MTNLFKMIVATLIFLILSSTSYYFYEGIYKHPKSSKIEKSFIVEKGEGAKQIAIKLTDENIISDPYPLLVYLFFTDSYEKIKAGPYSLNSQMSGKEIADIIVGGKIAKTKITVIEGWNIDQIGVYLQSQKITTQANLYNITGNPMSSTSPNLSSEIYNRFSFLKDKPEKSSLEGYLFPETYYIENNADAENIVIKMISELDNKITPKMEGDIAKQNKSIFQIITMASIIEKEVKTLDDKKMISGILWKRIEIGQPLQADATVLYALNKNGADKVYTKYTEINSPYNTYKYKGLPAGPICSPGLESIIAAIYPTPNDYFYYLSKPDGTTIFSKNLEEHNIAKAKYLK
jgi:UPF0755 protein